jgi:hypothetical protein
VRRARRRIDVSSLIWGLLFLTIAAAALWIATGHELRWAFVRVAAPVHLVCLGILGVVLSRRHHR